MHCDINLRIGPRPGAARVGACRLLFPVVLMGCLSGCALLQPATPYTESPLYEQQQREIAQLQQALAEKDAEIERLRDQQNVQEHALKQTTGEAAQAEVKLRRLATHADAASQLAEIEVALQGLRAEAYPPRAAEQLTQAQRILDAGAAAFAQGDYTKAVDLAAQSQEIIDMLAGNHQRPTTLRDAVEMPFQTPIALRTRIDCNLREQAGRSASVLSVLQAGTLLQAQAYRGEWLRVRTEDGRVGWVSGSLLEAPYPVVE